MKLICLFVFAVVSCKAATTNGFAKVDDKRANHIIEIRFANAAAGYSTVISAIQRTRFNSQIQCDPANSGYGSVVILSFACFNMSDADLVRLKSLIGSCSNVIAIEDTLIK